VRANRPLEALPLFAAAAETAPEQPYYQFVLAIAENDYGDSDRARQILRDSAERFPGHTDTLFALATMLRDDGAIADAYQYAERLISVLPQDPSARGLLSELEQQL
jgi:tetratricopeptide (TPR) repeat protein